MTTYFEQSELATIGLRAYGKNIRLSRFVSIHNAANISLGNDVRIDDFCLLSAGEGGIYVGNNVHIACYTFVVGAARIELQDFVGLSGRVGVYSSTDDFSGEHLTGPTVPDRFRRVTNAPVIIEKHVVVGAGSIVLPGVVVGAGAAVGAMSLVRDNCEGGFVYAGVPARKIKNRSGRVLEIEREYIDGGRR